jgi:hypothetical protein
LVVHALAELLERRTLGRVLASRAAIGGSPDRWAGTSAAALRGLGVFVVAGAASDEQRAAAASAAR